MSNATRAGSPFVLFFKKMRICRIDLDSRSLSRGGALGQRKRAKNVNMGKGTGKSREHDVDEYERQLESVLHRPAGKGCTHEMAANEVMRSLEARVDQLHWHKHPTYHATPVAPPAEPIGKVHPPLLHRRTPIQRCMCFNRSPRQRLPSRTRLLRSPSTSKCRRCR